MKMLTRRGVLVEEMGQTYLSGPDADGDEARTLRPLQAAACPYRIAFGPRAGQKVLTLRGAVPREGTARQPMCADIDGLSLHVAVRVDASDRKRLEQLCRYITRPALSDERVQLNAAGRVELKLKTPWRDGTTHLVMSLLEIMKRLAALATPRRQLAPGPLARRARERLLRGGEFRAASVAEGSSSAGRALNLAAGQLTAEPAGPIRGIDVDHDLVDQRRGDALRQGRRAHHSKPGNSPCSIFCEPQSSCPKRIDEPCCCTE